MRIFLITLSNIFFNPKILRFLFSTKSTLIWGVQCENQTLENRREFIREALKILHEWNSHLEILSRPQVMENSRQHLLLRTDILQKTVVGCPWVMLMSWIEVKCKSHEACKRLQNYVTERLNSKSCLFFYILIGIHYLIITSKDYLKPGTNIAIHMFRI